MNEIEYQYGDCFSYSDFEYQVAPMVSECIIYPDADDIIGDIPYPMVMEEGDYSPEISEAFERIGVKALDGKSNFTYSHEVGYIDFILSWTEDDNISYGRFPVDVDCCIIITPKAKNGTETAIH